MQAVTLLLSWGAEVMKTRTVWQEEKDFQLNMTAVHLMTPCLSNIDSAYGVFNTFSVKVFNAG